MDSDSLLCRYLFQKLFKTSYVFILFSSFDWYKTFVLILSRRAKNASTFGSVQLLFTTRSRKALTTNYLMITGSFQGFLHAGKKNVFCRAYFFTSSRPSYSYLSNSNNSNHSKYCTATNNISPFYILIHSNRQKKT